METETYYIVQRYVGILLKMPVEKAWTTFQEFSHSGDYDIRFETEFLARKYADYKRTKTYPTRIVKVVTTYEVIE